MVGEHKAGIPTAEKEERLTLFLCHKALPFEHLQVFVG